MSSCVSLTGFEEARVIGKDNSEIIVSANLAKYQETVDGDSDELGVFLILPNLEASYKRGLTDKIEVGARINGTLHTTAFFKYQLLEDDYSRFFLASGVELGTAFGLSSNLAIPLYMSFYPTDDVTINFTPRYNYQFLFESEGNGVGYLGGNFGLLFGEKNKFGFDIGYNNVNLGYGTSVFFYRIRREVPVLMFF